MNTRLSYLSSFFISVFSVYFLIDFLSPVYFSLMLGIALYISMVLMRKTITINTSSFFCFMISIYVGFALIFIWSEPNLNDAVVFIVSTLSFPILADSLLRLRKRHDLFIIFKWVSIFILSIEAVIRFAMPDMEFGSFYKYKTNSIMFIDSNFVALVILPILTTSLCLNKNLHRNVWGCSEVILFLLLIATYSRAAIFAFVICYLLFFIKLKKYYKLILMAITGFISIFALLYLNDSSFLSKFHIWSVFFKYIDSQTLSTLFFGSGPGSSLSVLGIGSHVSIIYFIVEFGFLTLFLYLLFNFSILLKVNSSIFVIITYQLASLSMTSVQLPYFVSLAFLFVINGLRNDNK